MNPLTQIFSFMRVILQIEDVFIAGVPVSPVLYQVTMIVKFVQPCNVALLEEYILVPSVLL